MSTFPGKQIFDIPKKLDLDREAVEDLLKRRFFFAPAFSIYGGYAGFYDYGPPGCAVKANLLNFWRSWFVYEEEMQEVDCTNITPLPILETSGHVERFADFMVRDKETHQCIRADHLLEDWMDKLIEKGQEENTLTEELKDEYETIRAKADDYSEAELNEVLKKYQVKALDTGNDITEVIPFNLMFSTMIGPTGKVKGFLRPETAQGIFVNFARLLDQAGNKLPFAAAQIGTAFRNEISPQQGMLRVREFPIAEIEHFCDPDDKSYPKVATVLDEVLTLFPRENQTADKKSMLQMTVKEALDAGVLSNETHAYYIARTKLFLLQLGVREDGLRFRQHMANEMAHYASDCWDAEILTTYGWIECVGLADRSCFDLTVHAEATKANLTYFQQFDEPVVVEVLKAIPNKGQIGRAFRQEARFVMAHLESLEEGSVQKLKACMEADGGETSISVTVNNDEKKSFVLNQEMVKFESVKEKKTGKSILPAVIEPSFGVGRVIACLFEHCYYAREGDARRGVMKLTPITAPVKCSILPLMNKPKLMEPIQRIRSNLTKAGISTKVDASGTSIGKRYARTDEIGIPFGLTIDFDTLEDDTVTLRDRDTTKQVRVKIDQVASLINDLIRGETNIQEVLKNFPEHISAA